MRRIIFCLAISTLFISQLPVFAQDTSNYTEPNWDSFYNQYYRENNFEKIITDEQFENAYRTITGQPSLEEQREKIEKAHKKQTKKANKKKSLFSSILEKLFGKKEEGFPLIRKEEPQGIDYFESTSPLLRLTQDAYYEGIKIPSGFYLVDLEFIDGKYFFSLRQSSKVFLTFEAKVITYNSQKERITFNTEIIDGNTLKLKYSEPRGVVLEAILQLI